MFSDDMTNTHIAVSFHIEAAHRDPGMGHPAIHGHSYTVKIWFQAAPGLSAESLLYDAKAAVMPSLDHRLLNDVLDPPVMENIAAWVAKRIPCAIRVDVARPSLGFEVTHWVKKSVDPDSVVG